ncbi:Sorting nexin-29 [Trichinella patagoniensis]|uniref:Sorting nexin-29 n=1 Tax=Trichinella patagoniensis TaxID=990121 RepID=A0A0V1A3C0_9BILA|nr:Sorting nexin-29 [Trichinella patagoniensis]
MTIYFSYYWKIWLVYFLVSIFWWSEITFEQLIMSNSSGTSSISLICHAHIRGILLLKLLETGKQCEIAFGKTDSNVATDKNSTVSYFLSAVESVLFHGLRRRFSDVPVVKEMTDWVSKFNLDLGSYGNAACDNGECCIKYFQISSTQIFVDVKLWNAMKQILDKSDIDRLEKLQCVSTGVGRLKAWLRCSLNEATFEKYLNLFLSNSALIEKCYEEWAFLRDAEKVVSLRQLIRGIKCVRFSLDFDEESLNRNVVSEFDDLSLVSLDCVRKTPLPFMVIGEGSSESQKFKRKPQVNLVSFESERDRDAVSSAMKLEELNLLENTDSDLNKRELPDDQNESISSKSSTFWSERCNVMSLNSLLNEVASLKLENEDLRSEISHFKLETNLELERLFVMLSEKEQQFNKDKRMSRRNSSPEPHMASCSEDSRENAVLTDKFQELAMMYSEVMEMNTMLVKQITRQNHTILDLHNKIYCNSDKVCDREKSVTGNSVTSNNSNTTVVVWIPAVFLTGKAFDIHHMYQIFIKINDVEFTMYRRYRQFYELRVQMARLDPNVLRIPFPGKKNFGHKNENFVELRRRRLEVFLRELINYMFNCFPEFTSLPANKDSLAQISSFFQ